MDMDNASMVQALRVPYHLLEQITDHFSVDRIIGTGGFGTVYMGEHIDGQKIAVKVLHDMPGVGNTNFHEECLNLACLQHKNIVRLVGYCHETTRECVQNNGRLVFADMTKRALCLEYVHNGSLDGCLSDVSSGHDWCTRFAIIKEICEGVKYLHEELEHPMSHLDLKPGNILLDENMLPKISDFGLSRLWGEDEEEIMDNIVGTFRYLPPEYIIKRVVSSKSDIFSLGVTVIEIMTGDYYRSAEMSSHEFIENVYGNWINRLQETSRDDLESYCKQVRTCAEIAISCVEADRDKRPTIGIIVNKLNETQTMRQSLDELRNALPRMPTALAHASAPSHNHAPSVSTTNDSSAAAAMPRSGVAIGSPAHGRGALTSEGPNMLVPPPLLAVQFSPMLRDPDQPPSPSQQMRTEPHYMSLQHLKEITKDFSEEQILGRGGSCVVYKGELQNGEMIAVKKVEQRWSSEDNCKRAKKQFKNEVKLLMGIKHPNIVKLLGHCYETHSAPFLHDGTSILLWQIDCLLCLEFLPENLDKHISDATSGLDWHTRYKIIEGICYGLQYLHEQSVVPVIHLDLKPGNILLDANMVPKIADFGISRLFGQGQTIHTKTTHGTPGYMPPEFIQAGIITLMLDIFSLGVIILEVITGHRDYPLDLRASSEKFIKTELSKWRNMLEKEPGNANIETDCQQIEKCIQIGLICLNPDRTKRPTMRKIANILQGL